MKTTLIQRLRNIWHLSEYQVPAIGREHQVGDLIVPELYKPAEKPVPKMAQIIKRQTLEEEVDNILKDDTTI